MPSRHRSRERALQILFQVDMRQQPVEAAIAAYYDTLYSEENPERPDPDPFMERLIQGTVERTPDIDQRIVSHSEHWRLERMPAVDRNILRLAIYEMTEGLSPAAVVINEALELARRFSGEESVAFVNGVLDAVRREGPGEKVESAK
jgi:transcription antitermination protein NusB